MTIPENVRDVSMKMISALPPAALFIIVLFMIHDAALVWALHDLQEKRIEALIKIFQVCTTALPSR